MEMFNEIKENVRDYNDDEEVVSYLNKIMDGAAGDGSRKIYGLGHAVYTISDPRAVYLRNTQLLWLSKRVCLPSSGSWKA
jgi:citrate synthase